jgi:phage-related protein
MVNLNQILISFCTLSVHESHCRYFVIKMADEYDEPISDQEKVCTSAN